MGVEQREEGLDAVRRRLWREEGQPRRHRPLLPPRQTRLAAVATAGREGGRESSSLSVPGGHWREGGREGPREAHPRRNTAQPTAERRASDALSSIDSAAAAHASAPTTPAALEAAADSTAAAALVLESGPWHVGVVGVL